MNIAPLITEAERYLENNDVDRASELFNLAQKQSGGLSPIPLLGLARVALLMRRIEDAKTITEHLLKKFPRSAETLTIRGVVAELLGETTEAISLHTRALSIDPTLSLAHCNLGRLYSTLNKWDLAAASSQLAIQHGAIGAEIGVQLGTAYFKAGRISDALKALASTVHSNPRSTLAISTLSDVLVETGHLGLARELLDNAVERLPRVPTLSAKRAMVLLRMKDLEAARAEAWRQTELIPGDEEAWLFAAIIDTMKDELGSAEVALKEALKLNAKSWRAHYTLGGVYERSKNTANAKKAYRAAIAADENAWEPVNNLAVLLLEEGTPAALDEARKILDHAARLGTRGDAIAIFYNLALVCFRLGDKSSGKRAAQELIKIAPREHPMVTEANRVLKAAA